MFLAAQAHADSSTAAQVHHHEEEGAPHDHEHGAAEVRRMPFLTYMLIYCVHDQDAHTHEADQFWMVGASMALGFAFMLVVDRLSAGYGHAHTPTPASPSSSAILPEPYPHSHSHQHGSKAAVLGLLVHATVDGVALGWFRRVQ